PERHEHGNPIYNVALLLQNFPRMLLNTSQLQGSRLPVQTGEALLDLRFIAEESEEGLSVACEYRAARFEARTIESLLAEFTRALGILAEHPATKLADLTLAADLAPSSAPPPVEPKPELIAISATFTAEPIQESLQFWINKLNMPARVEFAPYNQV